MHKNIFGRQFKRDINERKALFKGLMTSLVMHERIETTEEKAKAIRGSIEKLVTKAKKSGELATPYLLPYLSTTAVKRMIKDIAPRFTDRPGGYTRIIKVGRRFGDDASVVVMEWVENNLHLKKQNTKPVKAEKAEVKPEIAAAVTKAKPTKKAVQKTAVKKTVTKKEDQKTKVRPKKAVKESK